METPCKSLLNTLAWRERRNGKEVWKVSDTPLLAGILNGLTVAISQNQERKADTDVNGKASRALLGGGTLEVRNIPNGRCWVIVCLIIIIILLLEWCKFILQFCFKDSGCFTKQTGFPVLVSVQALCVTSYSCNWLCLQCSATLSQKKTFLRLRTANREWRTSRVRS